MNTKKYVVAVVGCGAISEIYFQNMKEMFHILDCRYCCDLNPKAAQKFADRYKIQNVEMKEILENPQIDIVVNLTPPQVHYEVIKQLLNAGKHVYTEKVLAVNFEEAKELVELAEEKQLCLCAAPDTFLGAGIQTCKFILDHGLIGMPTSCVAVLQRDSNLLAEKYPYTAKKGGGIGIDVGIYYLTALIHMLGNVESVSGMSRTLNPIRKHYFTSHDKIGESFEVTAETLLAGTIKFQNQIVGSLHFNSDSIRNENPFVTIYGTEGVLYLPDPNCFGGEVKLLLKGQTDPVSFPYTHAYSGNSRGIGVAEMAWAMERETTPRTNARMALHALEALCGIMKSGENGSWYRMTTCCENLKGLTRGFLGKEYADSQEEASLLF